MCRNKENALMFQSYFDSRQKNSEIFWIYTSCVISWTVWQPKGKKMISRPTWVKRQLVISSCPPSGRIFPSHRLFSKDAPMIPELQRWAKGFVKLDNYNGTGRIWNLLSWTSCVFGREHFISKEQSFSVTFSNLFRNSFLGMSSLRSLNLGNKMVLTTLPSGVFCDLVALSYLNLSFNAHTTMRYIENLEPFFDTPRVV